MHNTQGLLEFVAKCNIKGGVLGAELAPLPQDASKRKYFRLTFKDLSQSFLIADCTLETESLVDFVRVNKILTAKGVRCPELYEKDTEAGFALIEDLGNVSLTLHLQNQPELEAEMYIKATDILLDIGEKDFTKANLKPYSAEEFLRESLLFFDWYLPYKVPGFEADGSSLKSAFEKEVLFLHNKVNYKESTIVLRDFHADNIMILNHDNVKKTQLVVIDFQDALLGSPAYDMVSILEDARRDVKEDVVKAVFKHYETYMNTDRYSFQKVKEDYEIFSLQRNLKILGIFVRLFKRDGKDRYLHLLPRVESYIKSTLNCASFSVPTIKDLFHQCSHN